MAATIMAFGTAITVDASYEDIVAFRETGAAEMAEYTALNGERICLERTAIKGVAEVLTDTATKIGFA